MLRDPDCSNSTSKSIITRHLHAYNSILIHGAAPVIGRYSILGYTDCLDSFVIPQSAHKQRSWVDPPAWTGSPKLKGLKKTDSLSVHVFTAFSLTAPKNNKVLYFQGWLHHAETLQEEQFWCSDVPGKRCDRLLHHVWTVRYPPEFTEEENFLFRQRTSDSIPSHTVPRIEMPVWLSACLNYTSSMPHRGSETVPITSLNILSHKSNQSCEKEHLNRFYHV